MLFRLKNLALLAGAALMLAGAAFGQTSSVEGIVKGEDGQPIKGAVVVFDRQDIKGSYKVTTDKKGHYGHYGLPLGTYNITVNVDGQMKDKLSNVKTHLGDPLVENFDLKKSQEETKQLAQAAASGTLTKEQERSLSPEQKAALEKQTKEREAQLSKNKALSDSYNAGKTALEAKNYDEAIAQFEKAASIDANQAAIYSHLAEAYEGQAQAKPAEAADLRQKEFDSWKKSIELDPNDAAAYNNYALAQGRAKNIPEAQANIEKAAQLDPTNAGKYYYNLGAILTNSGQTAPACETFKKAITADPAYADAQYQYGLCLVSEAKVDDKTGKVVPVPGTVEALQKYLELKPTGSNAESAKAMLASMQEGVATSYSNPDAKKTKKK